MAFIQQTPLSFTRADIEALRPGQIGVYGIYRYGTWIYVGKGDIRQRLLDHIGGDNPSILNEFPTNFVAEVIGVDPTSREKQLIAELGPICNRRIG